MAKPFLVNRAASWLRTKSEFGFPFDDKYCTTGYVLKCTDIGYKLSFFFFFSGVGLTSPGTAATSGLLYSLR
jgi:hypothetical protein